MNTLPAPAADALQALATAFSDLASNERWPSKDKTVQAKDKLQVDAATKKLIAELMRAGMNVDALSCLVDMCEGCAWLAANERKGYKADAARDETKIKNAFAKLVATKLVTDELAKNIKELATYCGWYAANTKASGGVLGGLVTSMPLLNKDLKKHAENDQAKIVMYKSKIVGTA